MAKEDWLARWRDGRIGWHRDEVTPMLRQHWFELELPADTRVLVPLCGKTLDMHWLAGRGLEVLGVELSELAVQQFFAEAGLQPERWSTSQGVHYRAGRVEIIVGDIFDVDASVLAGCTAVYDRAALVALPPVQRHPYVRTVYDRLPAGSAGLLIALEYPQANMAGPPFSVPGTEVRELFAAEWKVSLRQRHETNGPGRAHADTVFAATVYHLERR